MADLNTNQYLYNKPYLQNQPTYGDGKGGFPTSIDDKRLDPVKEKAKKDINTNPVVSTAKTLLGEPVNIAIGTVPFLAIDRLLKWLPKGKNYETSNLGKIIKRIDNFAEKLPKFNWIKNKYNNLPETNFIKQLINAKSETPRFSMAKSQVMSGRATILNQMLDEAVEITGKDGGKTVKAFKKALENPKIAKRFLNRYKKDIYDIAYDSAHKLAGDNLSEKFIALGNRAQFYTGKHSVISKTLMSIYNNMATFLTAHIGKLQRGFSIKSLGANALKLGGVAFMFCMGANLLGKIVKNTWDAPKNEKISTLAHSTVVELGSWLMMIPLGAFLFKGIGSLKNLQGGNLISRAIKLGNLFSVGLKTKKGGILKMIPNAIKRVGGGFGRLGLFMFALSPFTDKILRFVSHNIFGKPNALLAKEKAEEESGKTENAATPNNTDDLKKALEQHKAGMITVAAKNQINSTGNTKNNTNSMIEKYLSQRISEPQLKPVSPQEIPAKQQYIPSDTSKIQQENIEKKVKFDTTLAKTDSIIRNAESTLGSV